MSENSSGHLTRLHNNHNDYHFLLPNHVQMIDEALCSLGEYGEVRLVVEKGRLRFLITQKSFDALKWYPGRLFRDTEP